MWSMSCVCVCVCMCVYVRMRACVRVCACYSLSLSLSACVNLLRIARGCGLLVLPSGASCLLASPCDGMHTSEGDEPVGLPRDEATDREAEKHKKVLFPIWEERLLLQWRL